MSVGEGRGALGTLESVIEGQYALQGVSVGAVRTLESVSGGGGSRDLVSTGEGGNRD